MVSAQKKRDGCIEEQVGPSMHTLGYYLKVYFNMFRLNSQLPFNARPSLSSFKIGLGNRVRALVTPED